MQLCHISKDPQKRSSKTEFTTLVVRGCFLFLGWLCNAVQLDEEREAK